MYQNIYYDKEKRKIHIWDDTKGYYSMPYKRYAYMKDNGGTYVSIYGDRLKKVFVLLLKKLHLLASHLFVLMIII